MSTSIYLPSSFAAPITPAFQGAWNETTAATRVGARRSKGSSPIAIGSSILTTQTLTNRQGLDRQYILVDQLAAQTLSPGGAWTVGGQLATAQSATNDRVDRVSLGMYVVSADGSTLRGTMLALGTYAAALAYSVAPTYTNRIIASAQALSQVVAQDFDWLVIEIGHRISATIAGTTVNATAKYGEDAADLPAGDTAQTTEGAPWLLISGDISFVRPALSPLGIIRTLPEFADLDPL